MSARSRLPAVAVVLVAMALWWAIERRACITSWVNEGKHTLVFGEGDQLAIVNVTTGKKLKCLRKPGRPACYAACRKKRRVDATKSTTGRWSAAKRQGIQLRSGREAMVMLKKTLKILGVLLIVLTVGVAWAKGDWSTARSKAEDFKRDQQSLKKMTPDETRRIVTAICEARSTKERREVGREIASRAKDGVKDSYERLERTKNEAIKLLDDVLEDPDISANHSDARRWKDEVNERWEMIGRMTAALRGGNHPVVSFMSEQGMRAHREKQDNCDAKEFELKSGVADCINATGDTCMVIELKPDNSRAISEGIDQYNRRYVPELNAELKNKDSDIIKKLINKDSDFAKCKEFVGRVDCYKLCPDVNEDGTIREQNASWRSNCS